tara:strand:+ start:156 stop:347 length:192 start_codon:yes stop_codon:yes gene_type:complete
MKKIAVKYTLEIPEDKFEKVCKLGQCSKRELEKDVKKMVEVTGRLRVYEFIDNMITLNSRKEN